MTPNAPSRARLPTNCVDYTNLNGTRDWIVPHAKAGVSAPRDQILITLKEAPEGVNSFYCELRGIAKPQPHPTVAQASLPQPRTRTKSRTLSEFESEHRENLSSDHDSDTSSNAVDDPYSDELESNSEAEAVSFAKPSTFVESPTREPQITTKMMKSWDLLEDSDQEEEDDAANPASLPGIRIFGSTTGGEDGDFVNTSFDFNGPTMEGIELTKPTKFVANTVCYPLDRKAKNYGTSGERGEYFVAQQEARQFAAKNAARLERALERRKVALDNYAPYASSSDFCPDKQKYKAILDKEQENYKKVEMYVEGSRRFYLS